MFKKSIIGAATAALLGIGGAASAATVVTHSPVVDQDGAVKEKKVVLHENGDRTVIKKKTSVTPYGQTKVKKKIVRHTAGTPSNVAVVHRTAPVVVHKVRPAPTRTTVIRETTG